MRNTIITIVLLFIAVIGASIYYFSDLHEEKTETVKPLTFLPKETFLVTAFRNDATTDNIFKDFEIFEALVGKQQFQKMQSFKNKLLRHTDIQPYVEGVEMYVSLHPVGNLQEMLFTIPVVQKVERERLKPLLEHLDKNLTVSQHDTLQHQVFRLAYGAKDSSLYVAYHKDIFFATASESLLLRTIDDKASKIHTGTIQYFAENNSRNAPLSVYFVHNQVPEIAKHLLRTKYGKTVRLFDDLGGQSAWNLNFKNEALILSGESQTDHRDNYIELFRNQGKNTQSLYRYFPANTASYLSFSLSNKAQFHQNLWALLEKRKELKQIEAQMATIKKNKDVAYDTAIKPLFGHEFAVVQQTNQTELAFITLTDSASFLKKAEKFVSHVTDSIYRFDHANLLYALYGDPLQSFPRPYCTQINNTLIVANSQTLINQYLRDWNRTNLLIGTLGFKNAERIQGNEANVTYFVRTGAASQIISNALKTDFRRDFRDKENYGYQDFYSWSIQISGNEDNFLSSIYGVYKSKDALGATPEWTYEFDNRPITQPWVFEHSDTSQFILIQEQDHTVHGIHPSGKKMWSAVFSGRVVGDIQQLHDRSIVLVTDRNRLYRFNTDGKPLPGFSIGLPAEPSYSPTIGMLHGEPCIFIPVGREILVYNMDGKKRENWNETTLDGKILFDIHVNDNKVFVGTENGHFYQLDSEGRLVKEQKIDGQFKNPIHLSAHAQSVTTLYAVDTANNFIDFTFDEQVHTRKLIEGHKNALATFSTWSSSQTPELVVSDEKELHVFDVRNENTARFSFTFTKDVDDRPQFFRNRANIPLLGVASRANRLIYLFDEKGGIYDGFPIQALPLFYYGKIDYNSADYLLCVRLDKKLYAFKH